VGAAAGVCDRLGEPRCPKSSVARTRKATYRSVRRRHHCGDQPPAENQNTSEKATLFFTRLAVSSPTSQTFAVECFRSGVRLFFARLALGTADPTSRPDYAYALFFRTLNGAQVGDLFI
jgi:hypothetical protein